MAAIRRFPSGENLVSLARAGPVDRGEPARGRRPDRREAAARATRGSTAPQGRKFKVNMDKLSGARVKAWWYTRGRETSPTVARTTRKESTNSLARPRGSAPTGCSGWTTPRAICRSRTSRDVLRPLALRPRVVLRSKADAGTDGRVRVKPELDKRARRRVGQTELAHDLECFGGGLPRVRHDAVDYLKSVDVGIVLLHPRNAVDERRRDQVEEGHHHQERGKLAQVGE